MPVIYTYSTITPTSSDLVLLSDSSTSNATKTATTQSIADLADFNFTKTSITTAQLTQMAVASTPITLIAAPGAGKIVVPIKIVVNLTYTTANMTGNTNLVIYQDQGAAHLYEWDGALGVTSSQAQEMAINASNMKRYANTSTVIAVETGNPTPGASATTIDVYTYYKIITL